jgi:predicted transcriptional regulator
MDRLRLDKLTMADVAREFGLTRERVRQIAKKYYGETARSLGIIERRGIGKRARAQLIQELRVARKRVQEEKREVVQEIVADMAKLQATGMKQVDIAFVFGCSQSYVSGLLVRAGHRSYPKRRGINVKVEQ